MLQRLDDLLRRPANRLGAAAIRAEKDHQLAGRFRPGAISWRRLIGFGHV
jgi:hypothetical protein